MERFIELKAECKDGLFYPVCINVADIVRIEVAVNSSEYSALLVRQGKKMFSWRVEESYSELKARLGI